VSHSETLRRKVDLVLDEYAAPGRMLLEHPSAARVCPEYLSTLAYIPWTAVPLMQVALVRARELAAGDEVAARVAAYLERHIIEEMHGDEPGGEALEDLRVLGVDTEALRRRPAGPKIAQLVGAQYFYVLHGHPVAILGYMWVIEVHHPQRDAVERLIEVTGLPRAGFRQLLEHAELDVEHARELNEVIDDLPLGHHQEELVGLSALLTVQLLTDALNDVMDDAARVSS
jgi:hypothetical protein